MEAEGTLFKEVSRMSGFKNEKLSLKNKKRQTKKYQMTILFLK